MCSRLHTHTHTHTRTMRPAHRATGEGDRQVLRIGYAVWVQIGRCAPYAAHHTMTPIPSIWTVRLPYITLISKEDAYVFAPWITVNTVLFPNAIYTSHTFVCCEANRVVLSNKQYATRNIHARACVRCAFVCMFVCMYVSTVFPRSAYSPHIRIYHQLFTLTLIRSRKVPNIYA